MLGFLAFIILLPIIVFVHEFGHFLFARINGVKVEAFSIGFGPVLCSWKDKYNTQWQLSLIPLGGYVKMFGQSDTPEKSEKKSELKKKLTEKQKSEHFEFKKRYQKASIVAAGPLFNIIFGFLVFFFIFYFKELIENKIQIVEVKKGSAAAVAGFKQSDIIESINGINIDSHDILSNMIQNSKGKSLTFIVDRNGKSI